MGVAYLVWTLYRSRGVYRLSGDTLHVPGHPPVRLDEIEKIDLKLWDRKGIADFAYATPAGKGTIRIDDFIYERKPTDQIFDAVKAALTGENPPAPPEAQRGFEVESPKP